jgi:hypothetical protein
MTLWHYLFIALAVYLAFRLGQASILILLKDELRRRIEQGESPAQAVRGIVTQEIELAADTVRWERHDNLYYAYAGSGEFLAQGQDLVSVLADIRLRYPRRQFQLDPHNSQVSAAELEQLIRASLTKETTK